MGCVEEEMPGNVEILTDIPLGCLGLLLEDSALSLSFWTLDLKLEVS